MNKLEHKGYVGSVEADIERGVLRGKLLLITDLVTYEAETVSALKHQFEEAVEDYLETCRVLGKEPLKTFSGVFNVRIDPECHKALSLLAAADQRTLNAVMGDAARHYILERQGSSKKVEHVHKLILEESVESLIADASASKVLRLESLDVRVH